MKYYKIILVLIIFTSCTNSEKYSFYGYDPKDMTEEELYSTYGLEAPNSFYANLVLEMKLSGFGKEIYHEQMLKENPLSHFVNVDIVVDSLEIVSASVERSDYSNKFNKALERLISNMKWDDDNDNESKSGDFDFRLDIIKLFNSKTFEPTPPKDSTMITRPLLNESLELHKEMIKESLGENSEPLMKQIND